MGYSKEMETRHGIPAQYHRLTRLIQYAEGSSDQASLQMGHYVSREAAQSGKAPLSVSEIKFPQLESGADPRDYSFKQIAALAYAEQNAGAYADAENVLEEGQVPLVFEPSEEEGEGNE